MTIAELKGAIVSVTAADLSEPDSGIEVVFRD